MEYRREKRSLEEILKEEIVTKTIERKKYEQKNQQLQGSSRFRAWLL